jgi:hypothetical protein
MDRRIQRRHQDWGDIAMKSTKNDVAIQYTVDGNKLILKEEQNLDGDFDDVFGSPESMTYTKVN